MSRAALSVGELIEELSRYDRSLEVVMQSDGVLAWNTVGRVDKPCTDPEPDRAQQAVALVPGEAC